MVLKFQYNKTALHQLRKALKIREKALPILQAKESALRVEVKKSKQELAELNDNLSKARNDLSMFGRLWNEFRDDILTVLSVKTYVKKIAGVSTPVFKNIEFEQKPFSLAAAPSWFLQGTLLLRKTAELMVRKDIAERKTTALEYARRKTTQKVNLYEKIQIPAYREAILKIKRYMEDEENLAKSSQKILKQRMAAEEASA